ncbi:MCE family protein [Undibacterium sp. CY18W]|uniref:MCE family protein n=1 Tax=Undibacterium hunanense TaxID=2762292 RepID=A0ABR6ZPQ4_9BURK|nr:MlaD family protein [Undibacterium hunanense]MBC3917852.1 MCE family protein [Undibacterium hunanense]
MSDPTSEQPDASPADKATDKAIDKANEAAGTAADNATDTVAAVDAIVPVIKVKPRRRLPSFVWAVPVIAALIGIWLVVQSVTSQGPLITITFKSAEGLEAGKTKLRYKDVDVGHVKAIALSPDRKRVLVTAQLIKSAADILATDTRFFIVKPRISGGSVSGLSTLLSGNYISVDVGTATETTDEFTGLEEPPLVNRDTPGREFVLHGAQTGSVNYGSPIFFRHINAGHVTKFQLDSDGKGVTIHVFIDAPYDQYVTADTRFWHASGVDMQLDANGLRVTTESLTSLIEGGLAFQEHDDALPGGKPAFDGSVFSLFEDREHAMRAPDTKVRNFLMYFPESLRGLSKGAPVDLRGIVIGEVKSLGVEFAENGRLPRFPVEVSLYPDRLKSRVRSGARLPDDDTEAKERSLLEHLISRGLRGQLRSGNLLTGQLYIALDFFPDAAQAKMDWRTDYPVLPTVGGGLAEIQETVGRIAKKIDKLPFDKISAELVQALSKLNTTLASTEKLVRRLDVEVTPELTSTLKEARSTLNSANALLTEDAPLQQDMRESLKQVAKSARAVANLADMLERHPDALVFGKQKVKP